MSRRGAAKAKKVQWSPELALSIARAIGAEHVDATALARNLEYDVNVWFEMSGVLNGPRTKNEKAQIAQLKKLASHARVMRRILQNDEVMAHLLGQRGIPLDFVPADLFVLLDYEEQIAGDEQISGEADQPLVWTRLGLLTQISIAAEASEENVAADDDYVDLLASGSHMEVLVGKLLPRTFRKHFGDPTVPFPGKPLDYDANGDPETPFVVFVEQILSRTGLMYSRPSILTALAKKGRRRVAAAS